MKNFVMHLVFLGLVLSILTGCRDNWSELVGHSPLKWATVDRRALEAEYISLAKQQSAGLVSEKFGEGVSRDQMNALEEEMNDAKEPAELRCMKPELRAGLEQGRDFYCRRYRKTVCDTMFDLQCIADIENLPEIQAIKKKMDNAKLVVGYQRKIETAIRQKSKSAVKLAIAAYASENAIELVVNRSSDEVLFTKNGQATDVTDAVMERIRKTASVEKLTVDEVDALTD